MRGLTSDKQGNCFSFGADMPGVRCTEITVGSNGAQGRACGNPPWRPHSGSRESGRGCTFFSYPNCEGPRLDTGNIPQCRNLWDGRDSTIRSFRCVSVIHLLAYEDIF